MKHLVLGLLVSTGLVSNQATASAVATDCVTQSIRAFLNLQKSGSNKDLASQIEDLTKANYLIDEKKSTATVLSSSYGVSGIESTFFVTTPYTRKINPSTEVVAAVVQCEQVGLIKKATLVSVLSHQDIDGLKTKK